MKDGKTYCITLDYKPNKKDAEQMMALKIAKESNDVSILGTFEIYANKYISVKENVLKTPTIVKYKSTIKNMPDWFKTLNLKDITQEDVQLLINEYAVEHKPKGVHDLHGFVASIIKFYRPNLILRTTLPEIPKKDEYEPTDDDIKAILKRAERPEHEIIFNLLVYGLRRSEALAVNVKTDLFDKKEKTTTLAINKAMVIDENGEYYIRNATKTSDSVRNIEILNSLADKMLKQGYVYNGKPHMLNKALNRFQKQLGIPHFKLHSFRSYYSSMMLGMGVPITYVETSGGWKHGSTALRNSYTYSQEQKLKAQQEKGADYLANLLG